MAKSLYYLSNLRTDPMDITVEYVEEFMHEKQSEIYF